jgi:hypothetical protein
MGDDDDLYLGVVIRDRNKTNRSLKGTGSR